MVDRMEGNMRTRRTFILVVSVLILLTVVTLTYAAIPRVINYQGKFTDKDDNPLSGNHLVTFRFYDVRSGGRHIWEEGYILKIENGIFNALLGSVKPLDIDFNKDIWLGIEVASDGEMSPRIKLASSAYAFNAQTVDMLNAAQLMRNDIDAVMSGALTLRKDLILKGDSSSASKIVFTDVEGREYYLWMDKSGNLRLKLGLPSSDKDGGVLLREGSTAVSPHFMQNVTPILLLVAVLILGLIFYSMKKKRAI